MKLYDVLQGINYVCAYGSIQDKEILNIDIDSRKVLEKNMFTAIIGVEKDGHDFINSAIDNGSEYILYSKSLKEFRKGVTYIRVKDTKKALALISKKIYDIDKPIKLIGVTGTNGKTTSSYMLKHILESIGQKVGLIGTIANYIGSQKIDTERTTPDAVELSKLLGMMKKENCSYCIMEVSSHASALDRIYGMPFMYGIFTNLTQDHLDFHKTFEEYYNAKFKFIKSLSYPCINNDDTYGQDMILDLGELNKESISYGVNSGDIRAENLILKANSSTFDLVINNKLSGKVKLHIPGLYNIYNALGVISVLLQTKDIEISSIIKGFDTMKSVDGRCEQIYHPKCETTVIVDYAHTPDGLENILKTMKEVCSGKLITVFGCGGDRDKTKRPIMGQISENYSNYSIITSDNPRTENSLDIIENIIKGMKNNYKVIEDRKIAIEHALEIAKKDDIVVIAGKGHENYQIIGKKKTHFSDKEVVTDYFTNK